MTRKKEKGEKERVVAMQEEREQKVPFHRVSNRGTWRCTFRDLCAHLFSGPSTSFVTLSRTAQQRRTSSYPLRWCLPAKVTKKRRDSAESIRGELLILITISSSMNNCYHAARRSPWICIRWNNSYTI